MKIRVKRAIELIDATEPLDTLRYELRPGNYHMERVRCPIPFFPDVYWIVLRGQRIGKAVAWWSDVVTLGYAEVIEGSFNTPRSST